MKKVLCYFVTVGFLLNGCSSNLPIYQSVENSESIKIDGTEYAIHKLSYNGKTYVSEPEQLISPTDYERFQIGKKIGKTEDDMAIYQIENDDTRIVMKGFMFPETYYVLVHGHK